VVFGFGHGSTLVCEKSVMDYTRVRRWKDVEIRESRGKLTIQGTADKPKEDEDPFTSFSTQHNQPPLLQQDWMKDFEKKMESRHMHMLKQLNILQEDVNAKFIGLAGRLNILENQIATLQKQSFPTVLNC
jgi:hypothetical protein